MGQTDRQTGIQSGRQTGSAYLLGSSLDGAVLAGDVLAVPVLRRAAGETEVGVTLADRQVARALLGVALGLTPAAREPVLTCTRNKTPYRS